MHTIDHSLSPFRYRFDDMEFTTEPMDDANQSFVAALDTLDWDKILERTAESAGAGIAAGVIKMILGPIRWERDISDNLQQVIGKLDIILDEIRELRKYISENMRANTRAALQANLAGPISTLTDYMEGIRQTGKLDDNLETLFKLATNDLTLGLSNVAKYQEPDTARPLGIPLYASIEAGLIMLIIAHALLKIPKETTKAQIKTYTATFAEWQTILKSDADIILQKTSTEADYLSKYPHRGVLELAGVDGSSFIDCRIGISSMLFGVIEGGVENPFTVVRVDVEKISDPNKYREALSGAAQFPFPYGIGLVPVCGFLENTTYCAGINGAYGRTKVMVDNLNARRNLLLENVEQIRKLRLVIESLESAQRRLTTMVG